MQDSYTDTLFAWLQGAAELPGKGPIQMALAIQSLTPGEREANGDLNLIFGMGGSGLASLYILSQLEYLFRVNSSYLNADGTITNTLPPALTNVPGLKGKKVGQRVNQIQLALQLYLNSHSDNLSAALTQLDNDLSIADRLSNIRPSAMHGHLGDASSEGVFYALISVHPGDVVL